MRTRLLLRAAEPAAIAATESLASPSASLAAGAVSLGAASASGFSAAGAAAGADVTTATAPSEKISAPMVPTRTCFEGTASEEEDSEDEEDTFAELRSEALLERRGADLRRFFLAAAPPFRESSLGLTSPSA